MCGCFSRVLLHGEWVLHCHGHPVNSRNDAKKFFKKGDGGAKRDF